MWKLSRTFDHRTGHRPFVHAAGALDVLGQSASRRFGAHEWLGALARGRRDEFVRHNRVEVADKQTDRLALQVTAPGPVDQEVVALRAT